MSAEITMPDHVRDLYWETYDDQLTEDFDYIGVDGSTDMEPLTDIENQVAELHRIFGRKAEIRVYRRR